MSFSVFLFTLIGFQSTHPLRDATSSIIKQVTKCQISIHAPLTGCDFNLLLILLLLRISIHAPLTGCDKEVLTSLERLSWNFNPRTPYGMRPVENVQPFTVISYFNPRTPYGMRLSYQALTCPHLTNFNPRTPYGMRPRILLNQQTFIEFQSTHPLRDATIFASRYFPV